MKDKKRINRKKLIPALALVLVFAGLLLLLKGWEKSHYKSSEDAGSAPGAADGRNTLSFDGQVYPVREGVETVLILGLDKYSGEERTAGYSNDRQADFLCLLLIDNEKEKIEVLQLNRDTMAEIEILGVNQERAGTLFAQLALAHTYGDGGTKSCENTAKAVSGLLGGMRIDHYVSLTMDAVALINDIADGVTLEVMDEFPQEADGLVRGERVRLTGAQALSYVRARAGMEESTNLARMQRQRQYLMALIDALRARNRDDGRLSAEILRAVSDYMVSDCTVNQLDRLFDAIDGYELGKFAQPEGRIEERSEYIEFYADEDKLRQLIIDMAC